MTERQQLASALARSRQEYEHAVGGLAPSEVSAAPCTPEAESNTPMKPPPDLSPPEVCNEIKIDNVKPAATPQPKASRCLLGQRDLASPVTFDFVPSVENVSRTANERTEVMQGLKSL